MGFWRFGREEADVETAARVVTATTKNGLRIRGKLTIHFAEPVTQAGADAAADECAAVAEAFLREAPNHEQLIGSEPEASGILLARYPAELPAARSLELAALHVVGDPALSGALRRASTSMQAVRVPTPPLGTPAVPAPTQSSPSPSSPPPRRRASSQMRALRLSPLPPNAPTATLSAFLAPLVHDAATRVLIGFLRAHDLVGIRNVPVDAGSADLLATLIPVSEAGVGGFEASRSGEIVKWQGMLGPETLAAARREAHLLVAYVLYQWLIRSATLPALAGELVDAVIAANLGEEVATGHEFERFPDHLPSDFSADVASNMRRVVRGTEDPSHLTAALSPLIAQVEDDLSIAARSVKQAIG
jgi:hypothetical protein